MTRATIVLELEPRGSGITAVTLDGLEIAAGRGAVVCEAARCLIHYCGYDPGEHLEAWRRDVLCLAGPVSTFAELTVREAGACFVRWKPMQALEGRAPVRATAGGWS